MITHHDDTHPKHAGQDTGQNMHKIQFLAQSFCTITSRQLPREAFASTNHIFIHLHHPLLPDKLLPDMMVPS